MLKFKTLLVLGAGASLPFGLPATQELRELVCFGPEAADAIARLELPKGTLAMMKRELNEAYAQSRISAEQVKTFRTRLIEADGISIDAFVKCNPDFKKIAALSIAAVMLSCEREAKVRGDWYRLLAQSIHDHASYAPNKLAIITFNYDRSLEFYLTRSFAAYRNEDYDFIRDRIAIHHVYGDVGELSGSGSVRFGHFRELHTAAKHLQFGIARDEVAESLHYRKLFTWAERIFFLGCGFWKENLDLLGTRHIPGGKAIFASSAAISESRWLHINQEFFAPANLLSTGVQASTKDLLERYPLL
jgi:hypothetical protein